MNKKTTIIAVAVSIVAVLVVAVAFTALKDFFKPVAVQEVEFVIDDEHQGYLIDDSNFDGNVLRFCVDDITSYQLSWKITPEDAENKNVTFASTNNKFTINQTGLVSFSEKDIATVITVKTEDGEKTDDLKIQTYSNKAIDAQYDYDTNTFAQSEDYFVTGTGENQVLHLYNGKTYNFILDYNVTFTSDSANNGKFTLTNDQNTYTVQTTNIGEGIIVANCEGQSKNINIKVVEKVIGFDLTNPNFNQEYQIGNKNNFTFPISVTTSVNNQNAELDYVLTNSSSQDVTEDAVFNGMTADLSNVEAGVYTLKVSAKYDSSLYKQVQFTLNNGYNVKSHQEMAQYYNDNNTTIINLVGNYLVELAQDYKDPSKNVNLLVTSANDGQVYLNPDAKFIYYRSKGITFNGNNHSINAYKVPHWETLTTELGHTRAILFGCGDYEKVTSDYYSTAVSTTNPNLTIKQLLEASQTLNEEDKATQREYVLSLYENAQKFVFENFELNGNLTAEDYVKKTVLGSEGYTGFTALNAFGLNSADVTFNNVEIQNFIMGIMQSTYGNGSFALTIKNSSIKHTFGYNVFTLSTAKMHIEDSEFGDAGHGCIYNKSIDSEKYIDKYTIIDTTKTEEQNFVAKYVGDVTFDNWIDKDAGTPFFQHTGDIAILNGLYNVANASMGSYASDLIKTEGTKAYVNISIMHEAITTQNAKDLPKTQYDFTQSTGYNANFNKDSFWTAFGAIQLGAMTPADAYNNLISTQSIVNDNLICCSLNASTMGYGYNSLSYFYMGRNIVTA